MAISSVYNIGDNITSEHQNIIFDICYSEDEQNSLKLSDFNGNDNGGNYKVIWIDMAATWWGSCYSSIGTIEEIHNDWVDDDRVIMFTALTDAGQPYTCNQWGNLGQNNLPMIINDGNGWGNHFFNWFNTGSAMPSNVFIDHNMNIHYKTNFVSSNLVNNKINEMLTNCGVLCDGVEIIYGCLDVNATNYDINASVEIWKFFSKYDINGLIGTNVSIDNKTKKDKHLVQIIDILGRETNLTNNILLFYIYNDGMVEKRIVVE